MSYRKRRRLFIDPQVQAPLVKRLLIYWMAMAAFITLPIAISQTIAQPSRFLFQHYLDTLSSHWPILVALSVMLPLVVHDTLKFSNRFAGPMYRLRRELNRFARGEKMPPLKLRPGDFWQDHAAQIGDLMERVNIAEEKAAQVAVATIPQAAPSTDATSGCDTLAAGV